jgi:hypothetical protein
MGARLVRGHTLALLVSLAVPAAGAADGVRVPRWQPHDFEFAGPEQAAHPFAVAFSATATGPGGAKLTLPGFYDGDGKWKVRVAPPAEGAWSLVTHSTEPGLDGRPAAFVCVPNPNPKVHGALRVDPNHPRHFVFEDGTRFFLTGYECDWLWALDTADPGLKTINPFLDRLAAHGFNYLLLNAYAHDTKWRPGKTGADDYGPPPAYAWAGRNDAPDHSRFNLAYWRHFDRVLDALHRRGLVAHLMIKVYNKQVRWPAPGSADDDRYFRWLVARYAAYPNVVWDFSKEAHNEKDLDYKLGRLRFLRATDPYRRLLTVHDDNAAYDAGKYDGLLDFRADQQHSQWGAFIARQRQQRLWPVVNIELGYEHGPKGPADKTYGQAQTPEEVCRRAWEVCLAGGYAVYYYTYTAWDVIRPEDVPPGYDYFRRLRDFFDRTGYWLMEPANERVSAGWCLANPGQEYVVFLNNARPFTLRLEGPLKAEWYQPLTGQRVPAGTVPGGTARLQPPAAWGDGPVALHVGARPAAPR